jgi:hypothetical protein
VDENLASLTEMIAPAVRAEAGQVLVRLAESIFLQGGICSVIRNRTAIDLGAMQTMM